MDKKTALLSILVAVAISNNCFASDQRLGLPQAGSNMGRSRVFLAQATSTLADPRILLTQAKSDLQHRNYMQAEEAFRRLSIGYPQNPEVIYGLAEALFQQKRYKEAAKSFLVLATKFDHAPGITESLYRLAQSLAELQHKEAACVTFNRAIYTLKSEFAVHLKNQGFPPVFAVMQQEGDTLIGVNRELAGIHREIEQEELRVGCRK